MSRLLEYLPLLMGGALTTVALAVCSALLATTLGLLGASTMDLGMLTWEGPTRPAPPM